MAATNPAQTEKMSILTRNQHLGLASLILAGSVLLSRLMGLVRYKVISYLYGATPDTDIYFAAFVIPDFINYLLAGGYFSITMIPLLSKVFSENNDEDAWNFFSAVFNWVSLAILAFTVVGWIFAPELTALSAPGFSPEQNARLAHFTRIILPAQAFFLPGACFTALLYQRKQFIAPALTPLLYNGGIIIGGVLFYYISPESGMEGFCWGVLAGAGVGSLALPYFAARSGGLKINLKFRHPLLKRFAILALPLMLGQSIVALDEQLLRVFGSMSGEGAVSLLSYAQKIMQVPVAVLAQAAGAASYPFLATLAAKGQEEEFSATLGKSLRNTLLLIFPVCFLMMLTAEPIIRIIFEQGRFSSTSECALLLQIMLFSVPFWGVQQLLGRAFYARQDTITPAVIGTIATALTIGVYWQGAVHFGAKGVAFATSTALFLYTTGLTGRWIYKYGSGALRPIAKTVFKGLLSSALATLPAYLGMQFFQELVVLPRIWQHPLILAFLSLCLTSSIFLCAFVICNKLLGLPLLPFMFKRNT